MTYKLTPWFNGKLHKPAREGLYQQRGRFGELGYQYWDGKVWYAWSERKYTAMALFKGGREIVQCRQDDDWRGILK